jgi:GAF domain-containing protein/anti-sigma regulatory factor (Ser/Thr protein kinase)
MIVAQNPLEHPAVQALGVDHLAQAAGIRNTLLAPLASAGRFLGYLQISNLHQSMSISVDDVHLLSIVAGQTAPLLENARLIQEARRRAQRSEALRRIASLAGSAGTLDEILVYSLQELARLLDAGLAAIYLLDEQAGELRLHLPSLMGVAAQEIQPWDCLHSSEAAFRSTATATQRSLRADEANLLPPGSFYRSLAEGLALPAFISVPLIVRDQGIGEILLGSRPPGQFGEAEMIFVSTAAGQLAGAVERSILYSQTDDKLRRQVSALSAIARLGRELHSILELPRLLQRVLDEAVHLTQAQAGRVLLLQPDGDPPQVTFQVGALEGEGLLPVEALALSQAGPLVIDHYSAGQAAPEAGADASLVMPLSAQAGALGLIHLWSQAPAHFNPELVDLAQNLAAQTVIAISNALRYQEQTLRNRELILQLEGAVPASGPTRLRQAGDGSQLALPMLLHKDLEQTLAVQKLSRQARRIQAGLEIAELVNRQPNRASTLMTLGRELLLRMDMDVALVAVRNLGGPQLLYILGQVEPETNLSALLGQRNPLRHSLQSGEVLLAANLEVEREWYGVPLLNALGARGMICLPVTVEKQPEAVVLAVSHAPVTPFSAEDRQMLSLLAKQAALALHNLKLIDETNRRLEEVNLLFDFSRQLGSLDARNILRSLVETALNATRHADAGVVLLWDAGRGVLLPQYALGYPLVEKILQIPYAPGEALPGQAFASGQPRLANEVDFAHDYNLPADHLLLYRDATRGRVPVSSLVIPVQSLDRKWGALVLDRFTALDPFTDEDLALLNSLAQQTALALENAHLYQAAEQRAGQLQALTDSAATMTSSLQSGELIGSFLRLLKPVLSYDTGTLWIRDGDRLSIQAAEGFEDSEDRLGLTVAVADSLLLKEMITTGQPIVVADVSQDGRFPALVQPRYLSWCGIPLIAKSQVIGVIALEKAEADYYTPETVRGAMTFAGQAAVSLENAALFEDSQRRTDELNQRTQRLALLYRLSTGLGGSLDIYQILNTVAGELCSALSCSSTSAVLFDRFGRAQVWAEAPSRVHSLPHALPDAALFGMIRESQGVFNTENVAQEETLHDLLPYLQAHHSRAMLALPLAAGGQVHGLLFAHGEDRESRFSVEEIELARTIANQSAISVQNARLYEETQRRLSELAAINAISQEITATIQIDQLLADLPEMLQAIVDVRNLYLALYDETQDQVSFPFAFEQGRRVEIPPETPSGLTGYIIRSRKPLLLVGEGADQQFKALGAVSFGELETRSWLGVPLLAGDRVTGVIAIQSPELENAYTADDERILSTVAAQIAIAIENSRLYAQVQESASDLAKRVNERTDQLAAEHLRTQMLLRIITELSASLDMDIVLNRTLGLVNQIVGAEQSTILLVESPGTPMTRRTSSAGGGVGDNLTRNVETSLAEQIIARRRPLLVSDLAQDAAWSIPAEGQAGDRSALAVPLMVGEEVLGALILFHDKPDHFTIDHQDLVMATAKQIAVAINNATLYRLIRDQAERLGDMLRTQHIETSRSQAILEAVADGVLVTDNQGRITVFNASAEHILNLPRAKVLARALDNFMGLFGKAAGRWFETIRAWSRDPDTYRPGELYSESILLDNGRVVSVNLAPVKLRNEFLGTVSIFRDVTHEVEIDRLKSEFVANVSHELRTPMTSIKGYVDILLMGAAGAVSDQQANFLKVVRSNTERLIILVNDLLQVSRLEAGKVALSMEPLDLRQIASDVVDEYRRRSQEESRSKTFELDLAAELPRVQGDSERIRQVIDNLVDNAYRYTPADGLIQVRVAPVERAVQVDVRDNGIGIPPGDQVRVFERFYRGEDPLVLETPGTGLGLSVVQSLVRMHGGRIWFESSGVPGEGTTFSFTIPSLDAEADTQAP